MDMKSQKPHLFIDPRKLRNLNTTAYVTTHCILNAVKFLLVQFLN